MSERIRLVATSCNAAADERAERRRTRKAGAGWKWRVEKSEPAAETPKRWTIEAPGVRKSRASGRRWKIEKGRSGGPRWIANKTSKPTPLLDAVTKSTDAEREKRQAAERFAGVLPTTRETHGRAGAVEVDLGANGVRRFDSSDGSVHKRDVGVSYRDVIHDQPASHPDGSRRPR